MATDHTGKEKLDKSGSQGLIKYFRNEMEQVIQTAGPGGGE